ncbi:MAG TPA: DUF433 domain-containing protein [Candidatus Dormibacteraeota bacterium]|nr:DUF433 domain-containing protein [Candidatus Dormibacteraeota bacterium]
MVRDVRFTVPLYTSREASWMLGVPARTFHAWARGYTASSGQRYRPIVTGLDAPAGQPTIPFIGLAEGMVVAAFRRVGVSMQHIRRALEVLESEIGLEHAPASRRLYTDGASILYDYARESDDYDYARESDDEELLVTVLTGQRTFADIIRQYLRRIEFDSDTWALRLRLPITERPLLVADPSRGFGQPLFVKSGAPVRAVLERFRAGESLESVARDFDLPPNDVEDVIRATLPPAA